MELVFNEMSNKLIIEVEELEKFPFVVFKLVSYFRRIYFLS